jgi:hypothetical protein
LIPDSEFVFLETDDKSINIKLVYREKKRQICGPPIVKSEAVLMDATLSQKDILEMRKNSSQSTKNDHMGDNIVIAESIQLSKAALVSIINEMERAKTVYILNSEIPDSRI